MSSQPSFSAMSWEKVKEEFTEVFKDWDLTKGRNEDFPNHFPDHLPLSDDIKQRNEIANPPCKNCIINVCGYYFEALPKHKNEVARQWLACDRQRPFCNHCHDSIVPCQTFSSSQADSMVAKAICALIYVQGCINVHTREKGKELVDLESPLLNFRHDILWWLKKHHAEIV